METDAGHGCRTCKRQSNPGRRVGVAQLSEFRWVWGMPDAASPTPAGRAGLRFPQRPFDNRSGSPGPKSALRTGAEA
jgi:hypothetical protein